MLTVPNSAPLAGVKMRTQQVNASIEVPICFTKSSACNPGHIVITRESHVRQVFAVCVTQTTDRCGSHKRCFGIVKLLSDALHFLGRELAVHVEDYGQLIPPEALQYIQEMFNTFFPGGQFQGDTFDVKTSQVRYWNLRILVC